MEDIEKIETILKAVGIEFNTDRICEVQIGGVWRIIADIPEDLNAIRELEVLVIEKFGARQFWTVMERTDLHYKTHNYFQNQVGMYTADAATRIAAMVAVIEERK